MASVNPFDLLGDDDNDDLSQLIAKKAAEAPPAVTESVKPSQAQPKLPSKPLPPAQAVRENRNEGRGGGRGGGGGGGRGFSRGRGGREGGGREGGFNRDRYNNENSFSNNGASGGYVAPTEDGEVDKSSERRGGAYGGPRSSYRGVRRGGFNNGEADGERPRRVFDRRSGSGRGSEIKKEGGGRGNWGSATDETIQDPEEVANPEEKIVTPEKQPGEEETADANKENPVTGPEEKEPEEKEMTLDEYQKILEEKRKALQALKVEERKVTVDKELASMQQLAGKKSNTDIFIKLGSDKDKKKEIAEKDEKAKKSVSINEFLKPAEGEKYYNPGGRGRGRGRGGRGDGGFSGGITKVEIPSIADQGHFPNLGNLK
ncbi:hypothetical protein IFM89_002871 [Coptis chinensis]|uniref:Hyaluronan/mRNA-binding protein domain-containing protein n=1 Tax=Coptis chinensis TaxID=261450 RepID=A0A835H273_9MAGN|nr:hypothetical protein IFM89_002871 [Coptis chinensis]